MIEFKNLCVEVGGFTLNDISLKINEGEYFIILGPTGAGKTVLLESIAGLNQCKSGGIWLWGKNVTRLEPDARQVSIVYQDHALFPHLSVRDNIVFGLKMHKTKPHEIKVKLDSVVQLLKLEQLLQRRPDTLSGGEKQKVALARAIVTMPKVLLLDEPLGALDPETRENVQQELGKLQSELSITVLHVTHDFEEAIAMGSRVAVMGGGCLKQVGTPEEIFRHPDSEFVARFVMARNILPGIAVKRAGANMVFKVGATEFITTGVIEGNCQASIRPEDILITRDPLFDIAQNCFPATITQIVNKGSMFSVTASLPPDMACMVTRHSFEEMGLHTGMQVYLTISPSSVHLFKG
jgi:ABC-type Fe3+/spermidine/putrescine transport system ATPase subunit